MLRKSCAILFALWLAAALVPAGAAGDFETDFPAVTASDLAFTLTESVRDSFAARLDVCDGLLRADPFDADAFFKELYGLTDLLAFVRTQRDIADLLSACDLSDDGAWENYCYADDMYYDLLDRIRARYGEADRFVTGGNPPAGLQTRAEEFLSVLNTLFPAAEYYVSDRAADAADTLYMLESDFLWLDGDGSDEELADLYRDYLTAARTLAEEYGYESYYDYAMAEEYYRDLGRAEISEFRRYVKEYAVPLYEKVQKKTTGDAYVLAEPYWTRQCGDFAENPLFAYADALPERAGAAIREAFLADRIVESESESPYERAMQVTVGDTPMCYFPGGGMDLTSVSHELGHYYRDTAVRDGAVSYDLLEIHSTGNELLLARYLADTAGYAGEMYALCSIEDVLYSVLLYTVLDEFAEALFAGPADISPTEADRLMADLLKEYGIPARSEMGEHLLAARQEFFLDTPMYSFSYAVSGVAALEIFERSGADFTGASLCWQSLVERAEDGTLAGALADAGLASPFTEEAFRALSSLGEDLPTPVPIRLILSAAAVLLFFLLQYLLYRILLRSQRISRPADTDTAGDGAAGAL